MTTLNANAVISNSSLTLKDKYFRNFITDDDDTCMDVAASCNCYSKLRFPLQDTIRITDMNKLPVTGFAYGPFTHPNAQAAVRLNSLECSGPPLPPPQPIITRDVCGEVTNAEVSTNVVPTNDGIELTDELEECIKLAKTCSNLAGCGLNESGEYELPRPGWYGEEPIRVICNFTTNSTTIRPTYINEIRLQNCDGGPGCASVNISYGVNMDQITSIVESSFSCKQEIVFSCSLAPLVFNGVSFASWRYRDEQKQAITQYNAECKCSNLKLKTLKNKIQICISFSDYDDTCMNMEDSCNCYSKLRLPSLQDTLSITDRNKLPVTGFAYGPFSSDNAQAAIRFKNLECFGYPPIFSSISRDDCSAVKYLNNSRLQLDLEFVTNGNDCYVEINFNFKTHLKLHVSTATVSTYDTYVFHFNI